LAALIKAGGAPATAALIGMLDDRSNAWPKTTPGQLRSELRDCALGGLVKLNGKDPKDYGLTETVRWTRKADSPEAAVIQLYGFATEKARTDGLAKWRAEAGRK
jgi:hypothetical protein